MGLMSKKSVIKEYGVTTKSYKSACGNVTMWQARSNNGEVFNTAFGRSEWEATSAVIQQIKKRKSTDCQLPLQPLSFTKALEFAIIQSRSCPSGPEPIQPIASVS